MLQYSSVVLVARPEFIQTYIQLHYLAVLLEDSGPELFHRQPSPALVDITKREDCIGSKETRLSSCSLA